VHSESSGLNPTWVHIWRFRRAARGGCHRGPCREIVRRKKKRVEPGQPDFSENFSFKKIYTNLIKKKRRVKPAEPELCGKYEKSDGDDFIEKIEK